MEETIISKKELEELLNLKGKVRGIEIKGEMEFILRKKGKESLEKLEDAMDKLGYPLKFKEIKTMSFYPIGLEAVTLSVIKNIFNYNDENFKEMGEWGAKLSMMIRLLMKYFFSIEKVIEEGSKLWKRVYTIGELKVLEFDKEKKHIILTVEDFHFHPLHCKVLSGVLSQVVQMILKTEVSCEEVKCLYAGDERHEFLIEW